MQYPTNGGLNMEIIKQIVIVIILLYILWRVVKVLMRDFIKTSKELANDFRTISSENRTIHPE